MLETVTQWTALRKTQGLTHHDLSQGFDVLGIVVTGCHGQGPRHDLSQEGVLERVSVHHQAGLDQQVHRGEVDPQKLLSVQRVQGRQLALDSCQGSD